MKSGIKLLLALMVIHMACQGGEHQRLPQRCPEFKMGTERLVGGPCEGCEAILEAPDLAAINPVDTLPGFKKEENPLLITGTIYQPNGADPACGVIVYIYHTNEEGIYPTKGGEMGWGRRHGYLRGWTKTDHHGKFSFYTSKPASYPGRNVPAHVHITLLEPGGRYYWVEEYLFEGDEFLPASSINEKRGGNTGLVSLEKKASLLVAERDLILGANIPAYD